MLVRGSARFELSGVKYSNTWSYAKFSSGINASLYVVLSSCMPCMSLEYQNTLHVCFLPCDRKSVGQYNQCMPQPWEEWHVWGSYRSRWCTTAFLYYCGWLYFLLWCTIAVTYWIFCGMKRIRRPIETYRRIYKGSVPSDWLYSMWHAAKFRYLMWWRLCFFYHLLFIQILQ